jgi:hypothetical protein
MTLAHWPKADLRANALRSEEYIKLYQFSAGSGKAAPPPHIYALAERFLLPLSSPCSSL